MTFAPVKSVREAQALGMPISIIEQLINSGQLQDPVAQPELPNIGQPVPPAPMEAAMAPQQPQGFQVNAEGQAPPISGIEQAMMGEDFESQAIAEMPNAPPQKKLGLLGRIKQQPGGSRALLALGASLLSNKDFFSGLGQGAMAYQGVLDEEAEKRKPKVDYLAQGAFQVTYDPVTGKRVIERTPVADFEEKNLGTKLATQQLIAQGRNETSIINNKADNDAEWRRAKAKIDADKEIATLNNDAEMQRVLKVTERALEVARIRGEGSAGSDGRAVPNIKAIEARKQAQLDVVNIDRSIKGISGILSDMSSGKFNPDILSNLTSAARTSTGLFGTTDYDLTKQRLESVVQGAVRSILSSNVGVQTQMDAERAQAEILSSKSSGPVVRDALRRLQTYLNEARGVYDDTLETFDTIYDFGDNPKARKPKAESLEDIAAEFGLDI